MLIAALLEYITCSSLKHNTFGIMVSTTWKMYSKPHLRKNTIIKKINPKRANYTFLETSFKNICVK